MGKKRIATIGEETPKGGKPKKEDQGRKLVKSGKQQGRLTDMGQVALAEADRIKKKEEELKKEALKAAKDEDKKQATQKHQISKDVKKKGKRYLKAKGKINATKKYPIGQAIKLVKETSITRFKSKVELHLVVREKGLKRALEVPYPENKKERKITLTTEKKFPLVHLVLGKLETKEAELAANFEAIITSIGKNNVKKAVICSTMGPGIKVDFDPKA